MGSVILVLLFFLSMGLLIWGIGIYRETIIEARYLLVTIICAIFIGEVSLSFLIRNCPRTIWSFLMKALISGGIGYFSLLIINREWANSITETEQFLILDKGTLARSKGGRCRSPYIEIEFAGVSKQLIFYCSDAEAVRGASKVNISYSRGGLGFYIIRSKKLIE